MNISTEAAIHRCSIKNLVQKFTKFIEKCHVSDFLFNQIQWLHTVILSKKTTVQVLPGEFCGILETSIFAEHLMAASEPRMCYSEVRLMVQN